MKKIYFTFSVVFATVLFNQNIKAQCAVTVPVGSSSNLFTLIRNSTNPIAADKNLNTIVYAHRNNASAFGGNSGQLRYDVSTNGGTTWTNDQGVLNPLGTFQARYPNATIYNPVGNTNPNLAHLGYLAATVNTVSGGWNGQVSGVRQLSGAGNTENYNQPGGLGGLIPNSVVKGAPGVFWSVDAAWNGTLITGFKIYKGIWNGSTDIVWAQNFTTTPSFNLAYDGTLHVSDYNIAFDPTGNTGYMSFLGHLTGGPANYAYYPVLYKTIDAGVTWTGPIQVDLNQFPCITGNITLGNVATCNFEHDLTVDINGNPHFFTTVCNGNNAYSVYYTSWHHMFDITSYNGVWNAYDISNVNAGRGTWGVNPNAVTLDMAPQISRTPDGTKIFYSWSDNTTYTLGAANQSPNLFAKGYDVQTFRSTNTKDFTSCNGATNGLILFPHVAPEILDNVVNIYKLPFVYGEFTVPNDPLGICNFRFLNNSTFLSTDFVNNIPMASVVIQQGNNWLLCPATSATLSVAGAYGQVLWNNGTITNSTSVNTPSTYIVTARNGCTIGADTIIVTGLNASVSPTNSSICVNNSTTLTVSGNAFSYTWMPGNLTNTSVVVSPTTSTIYTVTATGNSCTYPQTVAVNVNPLPTITITGSPSICAGTSVVQTASGANTYSWSTGAVTASVSVSPTVNTTYTVTGTSINSCVNSNTVSISVSAQPTINIAVSSGTICAGQSSTLTTSGATSYTWNTGPTISSLAVSPTISTSYTVTGTGTNACTSNATLNVTVNSLPSLSITSTSSALCIGTSATLSASGANTYSWSTPSNSASIVVSPSVNTTYTLSGTANNCSNTIVFTQSVSSCIGIFEAELTELIIGIFPNPNTGEFTISAAQKVNLKIINELGQVIKIISADKDKMNTVDMRDFAKGIYFIVGDNDRAMVRQKFIIY